VPHIKQPLYDALSKTQLTPGALIRQHPVDDSWLLAKHRDLVNDFVDVTPQEKEYMIMWDSYVLPKHLSSPSFLPRAFRAFVKDKASWIVSKPERAYEFSKHVASLLAMSVIGEDDVVDSTTKLNEARAAMLANGSVPEAAPPPPPPKKQHVTERCTACQKAIPVPQLAVCGSKASGAILFISGYFLVFFSLLFARPFSSFISLCRRHSNLLFRPAMPASTTKVAWSIPTRWTNWAGAGVVLNASSSLPSLVLVSWRLRNGIIGVNTFSPSRSSPGACTSVPARKSRPFLVYFAR